MERNTDSPGTEMDVATTTVSMGGAAELASTAAPETGRRVLGRLGTGWRFTRHLLEMVVAMMTGMGVFGLALTVKEQGMPDDPRPGLCAFASGSKRSPRGEE